MAGIKLKAQGLGVDGILRIPSIDARDAQPWKAERVEVAERG